MPIEDEQWKVRHRIAVNVAMQRVRCGWSQEDLARRTGVAVEKIRRIEAGDYPLKIDGLVDLANALDVDVERLVEDVEIH